MSDVLPDRSLVQDQRLGHALRPTDTWFRPVDIKLGPDGGIYVADMYSQLIDQRHYHSAASRGPPVYRLRLGASRLRPTAQRASASDSTRRNRVLFAVIKSARPEILAVSDGFNGLHDH